MKKEDLLISIIIPYYNTYDYTVKLLYELEKQITNDIEVIVVDDHSDMVLPINYEKPWLKYIRLPKNSNGASKPRNIGLEQAEGKYIAFIDSDDMVTDDYIREIKKAIEENTDIIYLSWKMQKSRIIMRKEPPKWNCSVWCRVYKREIIGKVRFREDLRIAEDWQFNHDLKPKTSTCIEKVIYIYNSGRKGSIMSGG